MKLPKMKSTTVKALVHAGLALGALVEAYTTESRFRRLLSGAAAGYHAHATLYHLLYEQEETSEKAVKENVGDFEGYDGFEDI